MHYRLFKYVRGTDPGDSVVGFFLVGIPTSVIKGFVYDLASPITDNEIFRVLTQDDQPKLQELLGVPLEQSPSCVIDKFNGRPERAGRPHFVNDLGIRYWRMQTTSEILNGM